DGNRKMRFVNRKGVYVLEQLGANVKPGAKETSAMYRRQLSNFNNQPHFELSSNKQNGYAGLEMTSKMATVRKNKEGFTPRQVKAAMEARKAINHAEAIFGPDASTLKGKSTRPTPKKTYDNFFSPPEELYQQNQSITVCIDHMEIKNAKFLTCIDTTVRYCSCIPVQNLKTDPEFEALDKIFRRYNKAGFHVKTIKCDRAFIPLTDDMVLLLTQLQLETTSLPLSKTIGR
ncbi:unnamed protein product, partial [Cylindrotheca closterium]